MAKNRFSPKLRIKTGDLVQVITGEDKGKQGLVQKVFPEDNKAIVEGVHVATKHVKPTQNQEGGIVKKELTIHISNIALVDKTGKPTRVGKRVENGKIVRFSKNTNQTI